MYALKRAFRALFLVVSGAGILHAATEYAPYCYSPSWGAPDQLVGAANSPRATAIAWNGREYAALYHDRSTSLFMFRRLFADGTPAAPAVSLMASGSAYGFSPGLVWTGVDYGATWSVYSGGLFQIYFARLNENGALLSGPLRVSQAGATPTAQAGNSSIAWSGTHFAVVWNDNRNQATSDNDIFITLLDAAGAIANGGAAHDIALHTGALFDDTPFVAWFPGSGRFMATWAKFTAGYAGSDIWGAMFTPAGAVYSLGGPLAGQAGVNNAAAPSLVSSGSGGAVAWTDQRDGNLEMYFARISPWGAKIGADVRVTSNAISDQHSQLVWTGREYGLFYDSNPAAGLYDVWMVRLGSDGTVQGTPWQATSTGAQAYPRAAFGRLGYLLTHTTYATSSTTGANYSFPITCNYSGTPSCPSQAVAYGVTGTGASVAWQPSDDYYNDIAYYEVYRNGSLLARTSATWYNDAGLATGTTYQYAFRAVNAVQYASAGCSNAVYVRTGSTVTLTLNKSTGLDAGLAWTDGGASNYAVFRGATPQVMTQIGATPLLSTTDQNALAAPSSYFYSVDTPW